MQAELDRITSERDSLAQSKNHLTSLLADKAKKLDETLEKLREARDELAERREDFMKEMTTQTKLSALYKSSLDDSNKELASLRGQPGPPWSFYYCKTNKQTNKTNKPYSGLWVP
jgi:hypothetical protein